MKEFFIDNIISIFALLVSIAGFTLSYKGHKKSIVNLKISSLCQNNLFIESIDNDPYNLIVIDLLIENNSTAEVDISRVKLINSKHNYIASYIPMKDKLNPNGISLVNNSTDEIIKYNTSSENILINSRIPSYGVIQGFAVFYGVNQIQHKETFQIIVDTPVKSFSTNIYVNLCPSGFRRMFKLRQ